MPARADQLHSHQFVMQRVVNALAFRDPDQPGPPGRRILVAVFAGVMVAVLALAAVAVYGKLNPGVGKAWRAKPAVIVERETGTRLLLLDGILHPVLNYASARLVLGSPDAPTLIVAREDLAGTPRGATIGVPGLPDLLPARGDLLSGAWTVCSRPDGRQPAALLTIGVDPGAPPRPLGDDALLVTDPGGRQHLIWHGHRYLIRDPGKALTAFGWTGRTPAPIAAAALNALPPGREVAPPDVPRRAGRAPEVYRTQATPGSWQYAVARVDGLYPISEVEAALLLTAHGGEPATLSPAEFATRQRDAERSRTDLDLPEKAPRLAVPAPGGGICATLSGAGPGPVTTPGVGLTEVPPRVAGEVDTGEGLSVAVARGRGVIVAAAAGRDPAGLLSLVTDEGRRFPVPSPAALATLGYADAPTVRVPSTVVSLLPDGPALDPAAAREEAPR